MFFFFFQAEDGIRDADVTGVQTCALPICAAAGAAPVDSAHGRLLGTDHQGHGGGLDHRLQRADQARLHAGQRHLPALPHLRPGRRRLLPAVLAPVPLRIPSGEETLCRSLMCAPFTSITATTMCSRAWT